MTGAYGLTVHYVEPLPHLVEAPDQWPPVHLSRDIRPATAAHAIGGERATIALAPGAIARVDRAARTAQLVSADPWPAGAVVHPFLAAVAGLFAWWDGREPLHGGAFVRGDRAWALLAAKGGGKSTTLATLAAAGSPILADDLVVVDGGAVLAAPRCLDLREDAAAAIGADMGSDRQGRGRVVLGAVPAQVPLAGFVLLTWGDRVELVEVPPRERLRRLVEHRSTWRDPASPTGVLDLLALPAYELRRPRDLASLDSAVELLGAL